MEDRLTSIANSLRSLQSSGGAAFSSMLSFYILTLGCAKNEADSKRMDALLRHEGYIRASCPEAADCIIVNTCSFIQAATEESIEAIFDLCDLDNVTSQNSKIVVAGCMPSRYGEELATSLSEIKTFVPCANEDDIVSVVQNLFPEKTRSISTAADSQDQERDWQYTGAQDLDKEFSTYIKISDGCDRFCSFCTIPFIRGRYRSFSFGQINADVSRAISAGAKEIVLIAQDTGRWGEDFTEPTSLATLLDSLARKHPSTWFRVMYVQPEGVSNELISVMHAHDNIAPYLDIPFQHANARILSMMNRKGNGEEYLQLIDSLRKKIPEITLRTTLIVGFPGETETDFEELCHFVEAADLDYVGIFPYSCEEGTRAANLPNQIDEDEKIQRYNTLREIADSLSSRRIANRIGKRMDVLVLGQEEDGQLYGRALCQAPDVDGVVYLSQGELGSIQPVVITDTLLYEMEGE